MHVTKVMITIAALLMVGLVTAFSAERKMASRWVPKDCQEIAQVYAYNVWEVSNHPEDAHRMNMKSVLQIVSSGYGGKDAFTDDVLLDAVPKAYRGTLSQKDVSNILYASCIEITNTHR